MSMPNKGKILPVWTAALWLSSALRVCAVGHNYVKRPVVSIKSDI